MRSAAVALVVCLAPSVASADHVCETDRYSDECAAICQVEDPPAICADPCQNYAGVSWCTEWCERNPDRSCMDAYRTLPYCPAFSGTMFRLGIRGLVAGSFIEQPGVLGGAQIIFGARVDPEVSLVAKVYLAPVGFEGPGNFQLYSGAEFGVEWMLPSPFAPRTAFALTASAGVWQSAICRVDHSCSLALPMFSLQLDHHFFDAGPDPYYRPFSGFSIGVELGVGIDPWSMLPLGRASLVAGWDASFH